MSYVKIRCRGNMYEPMTRAVEEAREDGRILHTQMNDTGEEIFLKIPIQEAGTWIQLLEALADEEPEDEVDPTRFDELAEIITEESEKILGMESKRELAEVGPPKQRNFFRGI
jgi:hypothetical protein